jgi:hypothetical protein
MSLTTIYYIRLPLREKAKLRFQRIKSVVEILAKISHSLAFISGFSIFASTSTLKVFDIASLDIQVIKAIHFSIDIAPRVAFIMSTLRIRLSK